MGRTRSRVGLRDDVDDGGETAADEDVPVQTVRDILGQLKKRGKGLQPMPSTVARRAEQRKRRRDLVGGDAEEGHDAEQKRRASMASDQVDEDGGEKTKDATRDGIDLEPSVVAPQLRLDAEGNIVIDEASLVVTAGGVNMHEEASARNVTTVEFGSNHVTSMSFKKREKSARWTEEDTELFYEGLRKFGTDFNMISTLFMDKRSRKQIKLKFKKEERNVPSRVDAALRQRSRISVEELAKLRTG